jgi:hypothetical protein
MVDHVIVAKRINDVIVAKRINDTRHLYHFPATAAHPSHLWLRRWPLCLQFRRRLQRFPLAVQGPRPLQHIVYAVQVDGCRRTKDDAAADVS